VKCKDMFILDDILMAPIKGIIWIGKKVDEIAQNELVDDEIKLKRELQEAQMLFEMDEIIEEEYTKREQAILKRLNALRQADA